MRGASAVALLLLACAPTAPMSSPAPAAVVIDRLYFGRNIPTGGTVSDSAWHLFLTEVVTPRFPDGFTTWRDEGQWRGNDGTIGREEGFVFEVGHAPGVPADSVFEAISNEYIRRFHQEAVLRFRGPAEEWLYRAGPH